MGNQLRCLLVAFEFKLMHQTARVVAIGSRDSQFIDTAARQAGLTVAAGPATAKTVQRWTGKLVSAPLAQYNTFMATTHTHGWR